MSVTLGPTTPVPPPILDDTIEFGCRDECGSRATEKTATAAGWEHLPVTRKWRCAACHAALLRVDNREGA